MGGCRCIRRKGYNTRNVEFDHSHDTYCNSLPNLSSSYMLPNLDLQLEFHWCIIPSLYISIYYSLVYVQIKIFRTVLNQGKFFHLNLTRFQKMHFSHQSLIKLIESVAPRTKRQFDFDFEFDDALPVIHLI